MKADQTPGRPAGNAARWNGPISAVMLLVAGLLIAHGPILLSGFASMHGELGDTRLNLFILEHGWKWLTGDPLHGAFWDPPMFFPAKNTLAYSDLLLGTAPLYWGWRALGAAPDTAYQSWLLAISTLNYLLMLGLLRHRLGVAPWASAAGAFLFAFAASRLAQSGHFQLYPHFPTVAFVWAALESLRARTSRARTLWILAAAAAAVVQLYAGFYLGWFLALGTVVMLGLTLFLNEERLRLWTWARQSVWALSAAIVLGLLAILPMAQGYRRAADEVGLRSFDVVHTMLPRAASWALMPDRSWLYGALGEAPPFAALPRDFRHEHTLGIGPVTTLLAVAGLWLLRRRTGLRLWPWAALTLVAATLVVPTGHTLWRVFYEFFPGAQAVRAMTRVALLLLVPLGIGLAVALDRLERAPSRTSAWAVAPLVAVAVVEQGQAVPAYDKAADRARVQWLAQQIPGDCEAFLFTPLHPDQDWQVTELDAVLAADLLGIPTVNGYSGSLPRGSPAGWDNAIARHEDRGRVADRVRQWSALHAFTLPDRCWVRVPAYGQRLEAQHVSVLVPPIVAAGAPFTATLTFRNSGTVPWVRSRHFRLGAVGEGDVWGARRVELPADVPPGGEVTLELSLRAPGQPGRPPFRWRLLQEWMTWFGPVAEAPVEVVPSSAVRAP